MTRPENAPAVSRIRVYDGVVAIHRPDTRPGLIDAYRLHPWHCYNAQTGEFIECRTDEQVASYHRIPLSYAESLYETNR